MTAAVPSSVDRKLYGDLADDIVLLRSDGRIVARFKGGFRVDSWPEIFTAAQVRGMAAEVRNRRQVAGAKRKPDAPRAPMARHEIERVPGAGDLRAGVAGTAEFNDRPGSPSAEHRPTADVRDKFWRAVGPQDATPHERVDDGTRRSARVSSQAEDAATPTAKPAPKAGAGAGTDICGCGRPDAHGGRCWARRGWPGPDKGPTAIKRAKEPARAARDGNIAALWAEVDALKSTVERMRAQMAMEGGR